MVDTLFILLTTLNALVKQALFNLRSQRIDNIIDIINGPVFAASNSAHVEVMKKNAYLMSRLVKWYRGVSLTCGIAWTVYPLVNKALGEEFEFTGYFPFDTSYTPVFELVNTYMSISITLQAAGNSTLDCTIVAFYAQAKTQIQILRCNLEQLVEYNVPENKISTGFTQELQHRLKKCVEHYNYIQRFFKEVESIFREALIMQFFVSAWVICMTLYKIVGLNILSAEFVSMAWYLSCMLSQLLFYCYFGTQLKAESELVNKSLYSCNWTAVSPKFRRQLLMMMQCCSKPLAARVAHVVPISLNTYVSVLKASYTLFTVLSR